MATRLKRLREAAVKRWPWLDRLRPLWAIADIVDLVLSWWERVPAIAKHGLSLVLSWLFLGGGIAWIARRQNWIGDNWFVFALVAALAGTIVWLLIEKWSQTPTKESRQVITVEATLPEVAWPATGASKPAATAPSAAANIFGQQIVDAMAKGLRAGAATRSEVERTQRINRLTEYSLDGQKLKDEIRALNNGNQEHHLRSQRGAISWIGVWGR